MDYRATAILNLSFLLIWCLPTHAATSLPEDILAPSSGFLVSWFNDIKDFKANDIAIINVKLVGYFQRDNHHPADRDLNRFSITVNGKLGNSTFISGVSTSHETVSSTWNITFVPVMAGSFQPIIEDHRTGMSDQSLHFSVAPGDMYPSVCVGTWKDHVSEFTAGEKARISILPKDAFGNNISSTSEDHSNYKFLLSVSSLNGSLSSVPEVFYTGWDGFGYIGLEFEVTTAGSFLLYIEGANQTLNGCPLPFKVNPGPLDISKCSAMWNYEINALQIFSNLEVFIHQKDQFGNLVSGQYAFDVGVVEKATNLSLPISDLRFEEVSPGVQLLSFSVSEPGEFVVSIYDAKQNGVATHMHYEYTVFIGYSHGLNSVVNGSGLSGSIAGQIAYLSVYLQDIYYNPSPVEVQWLQVNIIRKIDSSKVRATVAPMLLMEEGGPFLETIHKPNGNSRDASPFSTKNVSSGFNVMYVPVKSGSYDIWIFCGNIPLNGGRPYAAEVATGSVDTSISRVLRYAPKVKRLVRNEIMVQLMDKFSNPVLSQQSKLGFDFGFADDSVFLKWPFVDSGDGTYLGYYVAKDTGTYNISVLYERKQLAPFEINVYRREYFPEVVDDTITVWENESIAFNVLENDHFPEGGGSIANLSFPAHGSLIQQGPLIRYTPYKGFFGNDSFWYTISDMNLNIATGTVIISVLISPPQFVSLPIQLLATEDLISPRFSGYAGFEIKYSDNVENISICLSSKFGKIYLAPSPMQFWKPSESEYSVVHVRAGRDLILVGHVQVLNSLLRLIQYLGDENFYGTDNITLSTKNKYGEQIANVPISVDPINDPPLIHVPEYVVLEKSDTTSSSQIFSSHTRGRDNEIVGDPDFVNFPGNQSQFLVMLSVEVNSGLLITNLPAELVNTTELILESKYHWQPLLTFVTISKQFVVKGKGFRFHGTLMDCNNALQQLMFQGAEHAVLSIIVNDLGNYGCYPDCTRGMSLPLRTEAIINLVKSRPMKSNVARFLGSVIIAEFISMVVLGFVLLLFICKCATALGYERRSSRSSQIMLCDVQNFDRPMTNAASTMNAEDTTGCSTSFLLQKYPSNFRQRSSRKTGTVEEPNKIIDEDHIVQVDHQRGPISTLI